MTIRKITSILCLVLCLTACDDNSTDKNNADIDNHEIVQSERAAVTATVADKTILPDAESNSGYTSTYTEFNFDDCTTIEEYEEAGGRLAECIGYQNIPLYVSDFDGRFNVDVGTRSDDPTPASAFNTLGEKIEWRLNPTGEPIAAIIRYHMDAGPPMVPENWDELAVISIGNSTQKSCYVEMIKPNAAPNQNEKARMVADEKAEDFTCN